MPCPAGLLDIRHDAKARLTSQSRHIHPAGHSYNFVLVNRYSDGNHCIGEHRDDESELNPDVPIASLTLGASRDFYFKHADARSGRDRSIAKVQLVLDDGLLLLMEKPTNRHWYHALPRRKKCSGVRINLTFRKVIISSKKRDGAGEKIGAGVL